jgi:hypothetical protein
LKIALYPTGVRLTEFQPGDSIEVTGDVLKSVSAIAEAWRPGREIPARATVDVDQMSFLDAFRPHP